MLRIIAEPQNTKKPNTKKSNQQILHNKIVVILSTIDMVLLLFLWKIQNKKNKQKMR